MPTITFSVPVYTTEQLMQEHARNLALINAIKQDVSRECDNINNPIPLFEQLEIVL